MPETVAVTFLYALGQRVRWAERPEGRWRVIERHYREGEVSRFVRYRLMRANDAEDQWAYEPDITPEDDA